jgi:4-hydroxybenzoate polyprenyltransferase
VIARRPLRRLRALALACHPEPTAAVTALASVLALSLGRGRGTLWVAAAVLAGQLSVGWGNDLLDRDLDRRGGRRGKPAATGEITPRALRAAAAVTLLAAIPLSLASGPAATLVHLVALLCAHAYNLGLKRTPASVVCFAVAFAMLPAFVTLGLSPARLPPWWAVLAAAAIGAGAHFTNALDDLEVDLAQEVRGLPQRLGAGGSLAAAVLLLLAGLLLILLGPGARLSSAQLLVAALALGLAAAVVAFALRGRREDAFRLTMGVAGAAVLAFLVSGRSLA